MPVWLILTLCFTFFFVTGFIGIWAIREGGSFAFLRPSHWQRKHEKPEQRS